MAEQPLSTQIAGLIQAISASIKDGRLAAEPGIVEKRAAICLGCDKLREKNGKYACVTCGCAYKRKVALHGSTCPLGKW